MGQSQHQLVRRISVFPMKADPGLAKGSEDSWFAVREILTSNKRFLIASKNFLQQKDVYQPRGELTPADAITLGTILDANALITLYYRDRKLHMLVYDADYGRLLWNNEFNVNPSVPIQDQLMPAAKKLANDFLASIPYQAYVEIDPIKNAPVYKENKKSYIHVEMGLNTHIHPGDDAQLIKVEAVNFKPVFLEGGKVEVYAEGKVSRIEKEFAVVELTRTTKDPIKEFALVRFPKEVNRLQSEFRLSDKLKNANPAIYNPEMSPVQTQVREWKPLVAAVTFIGNIAAFLLLAL